MPLGDRRPIREAMQPVQSQAPQRESDPLVWHGLVALIFLAMCLVRITIPSKLYFDEVHYIPAARELLALSRPVNVEHPMLGKELLALGIALFGDQPLGWRITPVVFGTLALLAAMRAMWFATASRFASIAAGVLIASGFALLVQARIAMLDVFMAAFYLLALWMCAAAVRENESARWRLLIAGMALGCAMAAKWNAIPLAVLPGLAFLVARARSEGWHALTSRRGAPVGGVTLWEAGLWLGLLPLVVYFATFAPAFFYADGALAPRDLFAFQGKMLRLQGQVLAPHTYQSVWYQWIADWRAIWYLYEDVDGAQRGILLVGNPLTMLLGLPAIAWCGWKGIQQQRWDALCLFVLYAVSLGFWIVAAKPVQFYYHYLLPGTFLLGGLALALDRLLWKRGRTIAPLVVLGASCALLAYFWPILTAAPLEGAMAFEQWTWLDSWR